MAVDRVDVVAQPQPGVGDGHAGGRGVLGEADRERAGVLRRHHLLEAEEARRLGLQPPVDPARHEAVVVVAADEHELAVGAEHAAEVLEHRPGERGRVALRVLAQLQAVTEDHQAARALERLEQGRAQLRAAEQVGAAHGAEVEVGDDERGQAPQH